MEASAQSNYIILWIQEYFWPFNKPHRMWPELSPCFRLSNFAGIEPIVELGNHVGDGVNNEVLGLNFSGDERRGHDLSQIKGQEASAGGPGVIGLTKG